MKLQAEYKMRNYMMDYCVSKEDFAPLSPLTARWQNTPLLTSTLPITQTTLSEVSHHSSKNM